jgi:hypothetical protein
MGMEEIQNNYLCFRKGIQCHTKVTAIDGNKVTTADGTVLRPTKSFWQRPQILTSQFCQSKKNDFASGYKHLFWNQWSTY